MPLLRRRLPSCYVLLVCSNIFLWILVISRQVQWQQTPDSDSSNTHELFRLSDDQRAETLVKSSSKHRHAVFDHHVVLNNTNYKKRLLENHENGVVSHGSEKFTQNNFWNMSYEERSKFQKKQVDNYCKRHALYKDRQLPLKHLILHKERKLAFCYVPKSACTTFKILILHSLGLLSDEYLDYNTFKQPFVAPQLRKVLLEALDLPEQRAVVKDYYKFVMFRHPLERLLSGYRSKMSMAMAQKRKSTDEHNRDIQGEIFLTEKRHIIAHSSPYEYKKWKAAHESYPVNITFSDFIDYWLTSKSLSQEPHFNTVVNICKLCTVKYDYYGNFKTFERDSKLLMDTIGALKEEMRPQYPEPSDKLVSKFYGQLGQNKKIKIVQKLAPDLELYYMLFPPEKDSHKHMLGIDVDID